MESRVWGNGGLKATSGNQRAGIGVQRMGIVKCGAATNEQRQISCSKYREKMRVTKPVERVMNGKSSVKRKEWQREKEGVAARKGWISSAKGKE